MDHADDPETLAALIARRASESGDDAYLEDARSDRVLTFAGLSHAVQKWVAVFDELSLPASAAVLIDIADPLAFSVVHLAAISSGRRSIPVDAAAPATELKRLSGLIRGASLVATDGDETRRLDAVARAVVDDDFLPTAVTPRRAPSAAEPCDTGSVVLFTSGSTGTPKGVELPEPQLLFVARRVVANLRLQPGDRGFNSLPLHHVNAEVVAVLSALVAGSTMVLDRRFHRTGFWQLLADRGITWVNSVPAVLAVLARSGSMELPDSVRFIRCASAPLPEHVRAQLGDVPMVMSWGMTEGASQIAATDLDDPDSAGTLGLPLGAEVQVRSVEGEVLPAGETGPLWIRGEGVVRSYLFGAAADRFDADGWLSTGDLGSLDERGHVTLAGRADDVINRGGEKVYPGEVEEVLLEDPRVLEAVVVGRPDDVLGAVPVAYVIPIADLPNTEYDGLLEALRANCEASLARFRRPVEISLVADLPRAAAGKVQRSKVRDGVAAADTISQITTA